MLDIHGLYKTFPDKTRGDVKAVQNVSFQVGEGEFFTLLGPSGCGKTTILRCVAGLERPEKGEISIDGLKMVSCADNIFIPANKRSIGMVFQSYAIWPHMNVFNNVAFSLKVQRPSPTKREIEIKVQQVLEVVRLSGLEKRPATDLSGGQQQRLALARAIITEPKLLLLDEPLSNLDAKLRANMRFELKRLQNLLGITCLYVTHDQIEALSLSDKLAVLYEGRIEQIGSPIEIYEEPISRFVADFIGNTNLIEGTVIEAEAEKTKVDVGWSILECNSSFIPNKGEKALVTIRAEKLNIIKQSESSKIERRDQNIIRGMVKGIAFQGDSTEYQVEVTQDLILKIRVSGRNVFSPGDTVCALSDIQDCLLIKI